MKKLYFIIAVCLALGFQPVSGQADYPIKLDIPIDSSEVNKYEFIRETGIFTGPSSHVKAREYKINDALVLVGINKYSKIVCLLSCDTNFLIHNFRYLSQEKKYLDSLRKNCRVFMEEGYVAYIPLADDWRLTFNYQDAKKSANGGYVLKTGAKPACILKKSTLTDGEARLIHRVAGAQIKN